MSILLNPVTISVVVLCVLCLMRLNIILSMLIACVVGGLAGSLPLFGAENSIMALLPPALSVILRQHLHTY